MLFYSQSQAHENTAILQLVCVVMSITTVLLVGLFNFRKTPKHESHDDHSSATPKDQWRPEGDDIESCRANLYTTNSNRGRSTLLVWYIARLGLPRDHDENPKKDTAEPNVSMSIYNEPRERQTAEGIPRTISIVHAKQMKLHETFISSFKSRG